MNENEKQERKLRDIVNRSGYPLQIKVEHLVKSTKDCNWNVLATEHPWKNDDSGNDGFIDLILKEYSDYDVMVVECKRVIDCTWIFFHSTDELKDKERVWSWTTKTLENNATEFFDWKLLNIKPSSYEANFCVVPGQSQKDQPMLERIAGELIDATECFAKKEYPVLKSHPNSYRIYYPVIVTTADLMVCEFLPNDIDIKTGEIPDNTSFKPVPYVRFTKSLSTKAKKDRDQRTVFVVNSTKIVDFLRDFKFHSNL